MTKTRKMVNMIAALIAGALIGGVTVLCAHTAFADDSGSLNLEQVMYKRIYEADFTPEDMESLMKYVDPEVRKEVADELGSATINQYIAEYAENDTAFRPVILKYLSEQEEAL